ncbi:MAG: hypothetical protein LBV51_04715 [Acholeplasmatales bacterium]|jgi:predicted SAM-dependent methyltransferase|nr:hypothetical protein [Acholeplasmatales bacterium]
MAKNKKYYSDEMAKNSFEDVTLHLFYGEELFEHLVVTDSWNELNNYIYSYKKSRGSVSVSIPSLDTSDEFYNAMLKLSDSDWKKLTSADQKYVEFRKELFPSNYNIRRATIKRENKQNIHER